MRRDPSWDQTASARPERAGAKAVGTLRHDTQSANAVHAEAGGAARAPRARVGEASGECTGGEWPVASMTAPLRKGDMQERAQIDGRVSVRATQSGRAHTTGRRTMGHGP